MEQHVRFCTAGDGVGLAFAIHGRGPPLVRVATWLTHLDFDWESPVWRHWLAELGASHSVVRYDERGCGLSDRELGELSVDTWVGDLEAVVEAAGVQRFALLGVSQGAAVALAYAVRHPERLTHLVLYGGYARGRMRRSATQRAHAAAMAASIQAGWEAPDPTFRRVFSMRYLPGATQEQMAWYDELQRRSTSADIAARLYQARNEIDVLDLASHVTTPTLVAHSREDLAVPVEEGRLLAARIRGARFVLLESANHILLEHEPAWDAFRSELRAFLPSDPSIPATEVTDLSPRELDVLELVAVGLTNEEIAERLSLSARTVERHLSNVYAKLRVSGKAGRAAAAVRFSETLRAHRHAAPDDLRVDTDARPGGRP